MSIFSFVILSTQFRTIIIKMAFKVRKKKLFKRFLKAVLLSGLKFKKTKNKIFNKSVFF
jgi:hypothetical protein